MKLNKLRMNVAIIHTTLEVCSMKKLADRIVRNLEKLGAHTEVQDVKLLGFTLRQKKETEATDTMLTEAIIEAVIALLEENEETVEEFFSDYYETEFHKKYVDSDFVSNIFDFSRKGRIIYVDVDD